MSDSSKNVKTRAGAREEGEPLTVWAGPGSGDPCEYCHRPIGPGEIEYEVLDPAYLGIGRRLRFHIDCYASWRALLRVP